MKKSFKRKLFSLVPIGLFATITIPIVTSCTTNNNLYSINRVVETGYLYDNKMFLSLDELATYYISSNKDVVGSEYYLGNIDEATLDSATSLINIKQLKPYNPNKIKPVYLNAMNQQVSSYDDAKQSYANRGLIEYQYYDFNNNLFTSENEAKESIKNSKNSTPLLFYDNLEINSIKKPIKFNPLSKKDLLEFKKLALNELKDSLTFDNNSNFDLAIYEKVLANILIEYLMKILFMI